MLKPMAPDLIDYYMPENGVFHNLILGKMKTLYKGHAQQFMHAFWGVGQMSFVKHAIFVNKDAPELEDDIAITEYILNRLDPNKILITQGIIDALDHTANETLVGGKLGVDATGDIVENGVKEPLSDTELLRKMQEIDSSILELKQYFTYTKNPITVITINKTTSVISDIEKIYPLKKHIKVLVVIDKANNDIDEPYMLLWRVVNNIDAQRDIITKPIIIIDGTNKSEVDGFEREWPGDTFCTKEVLDSLQERGLIDIDEAFIRKFGLLPFND
ncbi:UbiD family decarboxylase associated with menaquinone via futalosine [hydrothermal vent metagenome]|uniref:UbiD family decarboxylase associated with menaquinone via futalosine n=1 Tax=hydrothermal vent metagenome TaxID=652676 RepID=A0A1W1CIQ5_9ZZZZ